MRIKIVLAACGVMLALGATEVRADTIVGTFTDIVTSGNVLNDPALGDLTYFNNAATADYSVTDSADTALVDGVQATGSKLQWGIYTPFGAIPEEDSYSELIFFGAQLPANVHAPFTAGVLTFLNGTSDLDSLIFAATLNLYDNAVAPADYLGSYKIVISTTNNLDQSLAQDADYINITGADSLIGGVSIEAYEDSEGGTGVTADLTGYIVGDPKLVLSDVALAPGQDPATSGLLGNEAALGTVPEPSTWAMMLCGFAGLCAIGWRGRRMSARPAA